MNGGLCGGWRGGFVGEQWFGWCGGDKVLCGGRWVVTRWWLGGQMVMVRWFGVVEWLGQVVVGWSRKW